MKTCTTAQMNSTCASTLAARTSVNVNKICTLLMANAEVISDKLVRVRVKLCNTSTRVLSKFL